VGVKPRLAELWGRRDYCPELYDLAWSFASFTVEQFGQERYFALYRAEGEPLEKRMEAVLGRTLAQVEREWFECARSRVGASVREISRTRRYDGSFCSLPHLARRCR